MFISARLYTLSHDITCSQRNMTILLLHFFLLHMCVMKSCKTNMGLLETQFLNSEVHAEISHFLYVFHQAPCLQIFKCREQDPAQIF